MPIAPVRPPPPATRLTSPVRRSFNCYAHPSFIGGSNLTATKARLLLTACLMKLGIACPQLLIQIILLPRK
jgi:hypothetical protein